MSLASDPTSPATGPGVLGSIARVGRLARKELSEIFRDRRTIITLVLMPLLLYPLLSFAFRQFLVAFASAPDIDRAYLLGVGSEEEKRFLEHFLARGSTFTPLQVAGLLGAATPPNQQGFGTTATLLAGLASWREPVPTLPSRYDMKHFGGKPHPPINLVVKRNIEMALAKGELDAAIKVVIKNNLNQPLSERDQKAALVMFSRWDLRDMRLVDWQFRRPLLIDWYVVYPEQGLRGIELAAYLEQRGALDNYRQTSFLLQREGLHVDPEPIHVVRMPLEPENTSTSLSLTAMVPLILILMTITGAVYPAIDLTAGERERGTLEILVAAPVPRLALLFAKYVAVVVVAMLTATVNLGMMLVTLEVNGLTKEVFRQSGVTAPLVLQLLFLLILFAAFFSAVLLALTSFARSFKEAQAYLIPLMLASLGPGVIGMMPGLKLEGLLRVTPLLNIVLLARDLSEGSLFSTAGTVVIVSTLIYAVAAITIAAWIFGAEAVLYSEQSSWSDMFRRPAVEQPTPTVSAALFGVALIVPAMFLVQSLTEVYRTRAFALQVAGSVALFAGMPVIACLARHVRLPSGLQIRPHSLFAIPAVVCLGIGAAPIVLWMLVGMQNAGLTLISAAQLQRLAEFLQGPNKPYIGIVVGGFALIGVAEELFYRGFLFSSLRARYGQWTTIGISAILFGLMHAVVKVDSLVHSTLLGVLLGWVAWRMKSVLPGMVLHGTINATLAIISENGVKNAPIEPTTRMRPRLIIVDPLEAIPPLLNTWAVPLVLIGVGAIWWLSRNGSDHEHIDTIARQPETVGHAAEEDQSARV
jgi:sodium transport system permease protein